MRYILASHGIVGRDINCLIIAPREQRQSDENINAYCDFFHRAKNLEFQCTTPMQKRAHLPPSATATFTRIRLDCLFTLGIDWMYTSTDWWNYMVSWNSWISFTRWFRKSICFFAVSRQCRWRDIFLQAEAAFLDPAQTPVGPGIWISTDSGYFTSSHFFAFHIL